MWSSIRSPLRLEKLSREPTPKSSGVYLGGNAEDWDPLQWPLRHLALRWVLEGRKVILIAPETVIGALPAAVANALASLLEAGGIELRSIDTAPLDPQVPTLIAEVGGRNHTVRWAATSAASLAPGEMWSRGEAHDQIVRVTQQQPMPSMVGRLVAPTSLRRPPPGTFRGLIVHRELDGPIASFGTRLWELLAQHVPRLRPHLLGPTPLAEVCYRDRYLHSPLAVRLVAEMMLGLKGYPGFLIDVTRLVVETTYINARLGRPPTLVSHDWQQREHRNTTFESLWRHAGLQASLRELTTRESQHARELILRWQDGTRWAARFDHGVTFLSVTTEVPFPFDQSSQKQAERLTEVAFSLRNANQCGTYFYLTDVGV